MDLGVIGFILIAMGFAAAAFGIVFRVLRMQPPPNQGQGDRRPPPPPSSHWERWVVFVGAVLGLLGLVFILMDFAGAL